MSLASEIVEPESPRSESGGLRVTEKYGASNHILRIFFCPNMIVRYCKDPQSHYHSGNGSLQQEMLALAAREGAGFNIPLGRT